MLAKQKLIRTIPTYAVTLALLAGLLVLPSDKSSAPPPPLVLSPRPTTAQTSQATPTAPQPIVAASAPVLAPEKAPEQPPTSRPAIATGETPQYRYQALLDPGGPIYPTESFLARISAPGGWAVATTSGRVPIIAVVDTGFSLDHQALASRWVGTRGTPSWLGYDFVHGDNNPYAGRTNPTAGAVTHGTLTAGLASLLNPLARIMPLQALDDTGSGYTNQIATAVRYAADNGANIISLSLGTTADDAYLHSAIQYAISRGAVVVAAAGNDGCNCLLYPAAWPEVLAVGASNADDTRAGFSSYGANLDVIAPGTASDVCSSLYQSTNPTTAYSCSYQGTSFAAPIVSSLVSLLVQQYPNLTPAQLIAAVTRSADKTAAMAGQSQTLTEGYGRINLINALQAAGVQAGSTTPTQPALSMAYVTLNTGARSDAICNGPAGSTCEIKLLGPGGQSRILGRQVINAYGQASFTWSPAALGLATGTWYMSATIVTGTQATSLPPQPFVVN